MRGRCRQGGGVNARAGRRVSGSGARAGPGGAPRQPRMRQRSALVRENMVPTQAGSEKASSYSSGAKVCRGQATATTGGCGGGGGTVHPTTKPLKVPTPAPFSPSPISTLQGRWTHLHRFSKVGVPGSCRPLSDGTAGGLPVGDGPLAQMASGSRPCSMHGALGRVSGAHKSSGAGGRGRVSPKHTREYRVSVAASVTLPGGLRWGCGPASAYLGRGGAAARAENPNPWLQGLVFQGKRCVC